MAGSNRRGKLLLPVLLLSGCAGGGPVQPTPPSQPVASNGQTFEVAGVVTDEHGTPMPGATVTMGYWLGGGLKWLSARTDTSGGYRISFEANPLSNGFVARAQVAADGYEEYWRSIRMTGAASFAENFRLGRITRIAAGESTVLTVPSDVGECRGWVAEVCPQVLVMIPRQGRLSIEVTPVDDGAERPPVEVCCVDGNERYGNPMTVPVMPGPDVDVKIGLQRDFGGSRSFLVKTSLDDL